MKGELPYIELVTLRRKVEAGRPPERSSRPPELPPQPKDFMKEDLEAYERALMTGRGTKAYFEEACPKRIKRWKELAEAGNAIAQVLYGRCFYLGVGGVEQNYATAVFWYKKSADQGDVRGQLNLGASYQTGNGVPKSTAKALELFKLAADQNYPPAIDAVGSVALNEGRDEEALRMFRRGAAGGYPQSMLGMGLMYQQGRGGLVKSEEEAVRWFQQATDADFPAGMLKLGEAYANGRGVARDPKQAVELYRRAAALGDAGGLSNLGYMFERGQGVAMDQPLAAGYYRNAAEKGVPAAMYNIGVMYERGIGVRPDLKAAREWYRRGADKGDNDAKLGLQRLGG
jgi:hypothetical protein